MDLDVAKISGLLPFLKELQTHAKKSFSQNFLIDSNILRKIIKTAAVEPTDYIIEIGAGPGALTEILLQQGVHLIAIEKDRIFAKALHRLQTKYPGKLTIHCADICKCDITKIIATDYPQAKVAKVIANLPYQISSAILAQFLPLHPFFISLTFMLQHEVAQRIVAAPNCGDYSSLTLFTRFYSLATYAFKVSRKCFYPSPKVDSAVVHFALHPIPNCNEALFFDLMHIAFQHRRKMLRASLRDVYSSEMIQTALKDCQLNPLARPQELSLEQFLDLVKQLEFLHSV